MGAFYVNYTVKSTDHTSVAHALSGRRAFLSSQPNGYILVFDEESDMQNQIVIAHVAAHLSATTQSTVLAALNHDSDFFWYQLHAGGKLIDEYNSTPDYWSAKSKLSHPQGGNARRLCTAFNSTNLAEVEHILRTPQKEYPDATLRHSDLLRALALPAQAAGYGFRAIAQGQLPKGFLSADLIATN